MLLKNKGLNKFRVTLIVVNPTLSDPLVPGTFKVETPLAACGLCRLRKNPWDCHPEEPQAVLSEAKEGSP